jgi:outer membrane protein TolC
MGWGSQWGGRTRARAVPSNVQRSDADRPLGERVPPDLAMIQRFAESDELPGQPVVALLGSTDDSEAEDGNQIEAGGPLTFEEVLTSVEQQFPLVIAALQEFDIASARLLAAEGGFDLRAKGAGKLSPQGFYESEEAKLVFEQPTSFNGATLFGGYKLGSGDFPIWEGGLKTNEDGEFSAGVRLPLLQGRTIDPRRVALWKARVGQVQVDPIVLQKRLEATVKAANSYWKWVASGQKLLIARRLLTLADSRQEGIAIKVGEGALSDLAITENQRLVVERQSIVIQAERNLQQAAIALSLFWRGPNGEPVVVDDSRLPQALPVPRDPSLLIRDSDIDSALRNRPELQSLELEVTQLELDRQLAENKLLPKLDLSAAASQDFGTAVSTPDDKGPFEFDVFLNFDVPIQRRAASGKLRAIEAKTVQVERKLQFARESIIAEVQDGQSAVLQTWRRLALLRENAALAAELEQAELVFLDEGESELLIVNLREQQTASAASKLVDVVAEHFRAIADYRASLGLPYDEVLR